MHFILQHRLIILENIIYNRTRLKYNFRIRFFDRFILIWNNLFWPCFGVLLDDRLIRFCLYFFVNSILSQLNIFLQVSIYYETIHIFWKCTGIIIMKNYKELSV